MKFDLVRPCAECPFRTDVAPFLRKGRVREIERSLLGGQSCFSCHMTLDHEAMESEEERGAPHMPGMKEQHCAGALILLEKLGQPNQMMRWMGRITNRATGRPYYDASALDMNASVFKSFAAMRKVQSR